MHFIGLIQFGLISDNPYGLTQYDVLWKGHVLHKGLTGSEAGPEEREAFFAKGQACMRASALTKTVGAST